MISIQRYTPSLQQEWNQFLQQTKNGNFLFHRGYMDYHSDRFRDHSLLVYRKEKLFALLPGNESNGTYYSHQGLTYGGLLTTAKATAEDVCSTFEALNDYLRTQRFNKVIYKAIPWDYQQLPANEDLYALVNVCHAQLCLRNLASVVTPNRIVSWQRDRRYCANKAEQLGIAVERSDDFAAFWNVLCNNLMHTYQARPVHTLQEMELLHSRFPQNIQLYVAQQEGRILGGTVLYLTPTVVHTQYISATAEGKEKHALDALFRQLLSRSEFQGRWFDFGTSNDDSALRLNLSLIHQKEGFGGRGICYDWYEWTL